VADDFHDTRLTERRNPRSSTIDTASALEIVDLIGAEDAGVPAAVAKARVEIARAIDRACAFFGRPYDFAFDFATDVGVVRSGSVVAQRVCVRSIVS